MSSNLNIDFKFKKEVKENFRVIRIELVQEQFIELFTYSWLAFAHNSTRTPAHVAQFELINRNGFVISKCVTMTDTYDGKNGSLACAHALVRCSLHSHRWIGRHSATGRPDRQRWISESALDRRPRPLFRFSALRQRIPSVSFKFQQLNRDNWIALVSGHGTFMKKTGLSRLNWDDWQHWWRGYLKLSNTLNGERPIRDWVKETISLTIVL